MTITDGWRTRRQILKSMALGATGLVAIPIVGCGDDDDEKPAATAPSGTATTAAATASATGEAAGKDQLKLVPGWYRDARVRYYDFGMNTPSSGGRVSVAPIYAFITGMDGNGDPVFVDGQHNVVDVVPGDSGYSDLWEVHLVTVPAGYQADSLRSAADVEASGYEMMVPGLFVNCPIVAAGTTLEGGEPLVQGWNKGSEVYYPDFGANPPLTLPILAFATGMAADGTPMFVEGQGNIIDSVPADEGYSAFWRVNLVMVDGSYQADSIRSAAGARAAGFEVVETDLVVNCPVVDS